MFVVACDDFGPDGFTIGPAKTRDVILAGFDGGKFEFMRLLRALCADHTDAHAGIWITRLRVALRNDVCMGRNPVGERVDRHIALVHLKKCDAL